MKKISKSDLKILYLAVWQTNDDCEHLGLYEDKALAEWVASDARESYGYGYGDVVELRLETKRSGLDPSLYGEGPGDHKDD